MNATPADVLRGQLEDRRERLVSSIRKESAPEDLVLLLSQVDAALARMEADTYGVCEVCEGTILPEDLARNPLMRYCLCDLPPQQQSALGDDLDLAWRIQSALLPRQDLAADGWEAHYRYLPAGAVSGDYCDLLPAAGGGIAFALGDVSGKGVAASLLMAHLSASFRLLSEERRPMPELLARLNRLLLENTLTSHYATLACGLALPGGTLQLSNAGHCPPLLVRDGRVEEIAGAGVPVGLLADRSWPEERVVLAPGDLCVLYSDGMSEARSRAGEEYGVDRIRGLFAGYDGRSLRGLADACVQDVRAFLAGEPPSDDLTLLILRRVA